eukprot:1854725-Rhodomonas_salina.1
MDDMLAPFIRITHNIKGKQGKIQESGLTPTEVPFLPPPSKLPYMRQTLPKDLARPRWGGSLCVELGQTTAVHQCTLP